jgi:hypothetical protein
MKVKYLGPHERLVIVPADGGAEIEVDRGESVEVSAELGAELVGRGDFESSAGKKKTKPAKGEEE